MACSYHSQDTHRSGLPVTMLMGGGAAMGGVHGPGSMAGSVYGRSNPPSVANFPLEGSTRGAAAAATMLRGSTHAAGSGVSEQVVQRTAAWLVVLGASFSIPLCMMNIGELGRRAPPPDHMAALCPT